MSDEKFLKQYRIPSARAEWHHYNGGAYFITTCTLNRQHYFGEIINGAMQLTIIGEYAQQCIIDVPNHNTYAHVPVFVVMPNHIHLVVFIDDIVETVHAPSLQRGKIDEQWEIETVHAPSLQRVKPNERWKNETVNKPMQLISHRKHRLACTIGNFKSAVSKFAHENDVPFGWQNRFHDHIIRNTDELNRITRYIENNIAKWESDRKF